MKKRKPRVIWAVAKDEDKECISFTFTTRRLSAKNYAESCGYKLVKFIEADRKG